MKELFKKLEKYSISDAIKIEESDRQFIALKNLYEKIENKEVYLPLITANALICYQLSWKWEDYREEFSDYFWKNNPLNPPCQGENSWIDKKNFLEELKKFFENSKNNKRFIDTKKWRLDKFENFFEWNLFFWREKFFYENMEKFLEEISKIMNQKKDAKTIVFAVKMFWYWARNIFDFKKYPEEIKIPIDSRLENLFEKHNSGSYKNSKKFYEELSKKLKIPELHLDAILWVNYEELIN